MLLEEILIVMIAPLISSGGMSLLVWCYLILNPASLYGMRGECCTPEIVSLRGSALTSRLLVVSIPF